MTENEDKLEDLIKQMITPIKNIPLKFVLETISGKKVIAFDKENPQHKELLEKLNKAAQIACQSINDSGGILSVRANEVGNKVELPIKTALQKVGFKDTDIPVNKRGVKQSSGYPDLGFSFGDSYVYVECKTYNKKNVGTTQRSFFLSPTEAFKVTKDAIHIVSPLRCADRRRSCLDDTNVTLLIG